MPVSIPIGFSSSLQLPAPRIRPPCRRKFQSLSGFQVRCNVAGLFHELDRRGVSIPIGFSSSLQPPVVVYQTPYRYVVSIPIGFSSSLQRKERKTPSCLKNCFNPYRVFKFVATMPSILRRPSHDPVSIPIGFSSSLQQIGHAADPCQPAGFNPYRVFKFVATLDACNCLIELVDRFQSLSGFQVRCNYNSHHLCSQRQ